MIPFPEKKEKHNGCECVCVSLFWQWECGMGAEWHGEGRHLFLLGHVELEMPVIKKR